MNLHLKPLLPKTLFARAVLIVALPTVLVQLVAVYAFYNRHWENVTRRMANTLTGEIVFLAQHTRTVNRADRQALMRVFEETTGINASFEPGATLSPEASDRGTGFDEFRQVLQERIDLPFTVQRLPDRENMIVRVQMKDGVLAFRMSVKRLESPTTTIFISWMAGSSLVFLLIAIVFLRNQVRPIRRLAAAAENFGKGRDDPDFKPSGASEVRRAARAFLVMRERIQRQLRSRTEMLAGISHDLRTPLTRMKLQLAMLGDMPEVAEMAADVAQMEHMIDEYLDFAAGDGGEAAAPVSLNALLQGVADDYQRSGQPVTLHVGEDGVIEIRPNAMRRVLHNLIDNALRYGKRCTVSARLISTQAEIAVDDEGPGIPEGQREEVFRPFTRLDASRNLNAGGVGLGLTIARDIARGHGGNITLSESPAGGLRVLIRLPL